MDNLPKTESPRLMSSELASQKRVFLSELESLIQLSSTVRVNVAHAKRAHIIHIPQRFDHRLISNNISSLLFHCPLSTLTGRRDGVKGCHEGWVDENHGVPQRIVGQTRRWQVSL
ncbi:hypothetical protein PM082_012214 [Marasmius tenuissimus]|nr:hypothetical protein PM082_012214 [Marasmius tenuissimus]